MNDARPGHPIVESPAIAGMFKELSMVEMKHAYTLAERIDLLGAPRAGLALGRLRTPARAPLVLLTKAGGFRAPR